MVSSYVMYKQPKSIMQMQDYKDNNTTSDPLYRTKESTF